MGVWGPSNTDNDVAGDFLDEVIWGFIERIEGAFNVIQEDVRKFSLDGHGDGTIMISLDILITLCQKYETTPQISQEQLAKWRKVYLKTWDQVIDWYGAKPDHKSARRKVIEETFDEMGQLVMKYPP